MEILIGDCFEIMKNLPDNSFDSCVTDPPYGIEFLNNLNWDKNKDQLFHKAWATEVYRLLKPGAYLLSFASSRTSHRIGAGIEAAGFKVKDTVIWTYRTGFPKNLNIAKSKIWLDKPELRERYEGFGTALKPAHEPIIMAQKSLQGTYVQNIEKWGTGAINIHGSREANGYFPKNVIEFPKASIKEKNAGLDGLPLKNNMRVNAPRKNEAQKHATLHRNHHPTVKPIALMEWLIRLVNPPHGKLLDPFLGSGTTLVALKNLKFEQGVGIEYIMDYAEIAQHRLLHA